MSTVEIDRLLQFRAKGNFISSAIQFQQVTGVSDTLLQELSPLFTFPDLYKRPGAFKTGERAKPATVPGDINLATAESFRQVNGIGPVLSKRLIRFRKALGGFRTGREVFDVYGISPEVAEKILVQFKVETPVTDPLLNINLATEAQLRQFGYFTRELADEVIAYRDQNGPFTTLDSLKDVPGFPVDKLERIRLYLTL